MIQNPRMRGKGQIVLTATCIRRRSQIGELNPRRLRSKIIKTKKRERAMPEMIFVDSSDIEAIGYDTGSLKLHVRFPKSGETYLYYAVEDDSFSRTINRYPAAKHDC